MRVPGEPPHGPGGRRAASRGPKATGRKRKARPCPRRSSQDTAGAEKIKLLVLDCDGVLTDGRLLFTPSGEVMQRFSVYDGYAIERLLAAGVEIAILTGRRSASLMHRAQGLGIKRVVQGATDKARALRELARGSGCELSETAFVGDELFDIPAIRAAGWSAAPASARPEVKAEAAYLCECPGGGGAVREVAEIILRARDAWPPPGTVGAADAGE